MENWKYLLVFILCFSFLASIVISVIEKSLKHSNFRNLLKQKRELSITDKATVDNQFSLEWNLITNVSSSNVESFLEHTHCLPCATPTRSYLQAHK